MPLLNVRLDLQDSAKVRALRRSGAKISDILRQAIRAEYERRKKKPRTKGVRAMLQALYQKYPDPSDAPVRSYNVHDRHEFAKAFAEHIRGKVKR